MNKVLFLIAFILSGLVYGAPNPSHTPQIKKLNKLKAYLAKEKSHYKKRQKRKKAITSELDSINAEQNRIRERISDIELSHQELTMALENLAIQVERQKRQEAVERARLQALLKVVYRIKRDGIFRFLASGQSVMGFATRVRTLYRTLRNRSLLTQTLFERAKSLKQSETKIASARIEIKALLSQLEEQGKLLNTLLSKKSILLKKIAKKQNSYRQAQKEYKKTAKKVAAIFRQMEKKRKAVDKIESTPRKTVADGKNITLPVVGGKIIRKFGRNVHKKFRTVMYQKGIEIEAKHKDQVLAVLDGQIEYTGWIKGLGNVLILHHGSGLYTLSAHLFKVIAEEGAQVKQGEVVALVGDTGSNSKPSLYFELRKDGKAVDPVPFFPKEQAKRLL